MTNKATPINNIDGKCHIINYINGVRTEGAGVPHQSCLNKNILGRDSRVKL